MREITLTEQDLSMVEQNSLNGQQLKFLLSNTPSQYIKERPAKGGGKWKYVTTGYIRKVLNLMFGWDWDFEIVESKELHGEIIVLGRLTCRTPKGTIVKMQYGNKEIIYRKGTKDPLSVGNDFKAASSDALKKCAAEIGIAADVYGADDFRAVNVMTFNDVTVEMLQDLAETASLSDHETKWIKDIIDNCTESLYLQAYKLLKK